MLAWTDALDETLLVLLVAAALVGVVIASVAVGGVAAARAARSDGPS